MRSAGGRRKYGQRIVRYNTMAGLLTNSVWATKARPLPFRIRAMKAVAAPDIWHANFGQVVQVTSGIQKFVSFPSVTPDQLAKISNKTPLGAPNRVLIQNAQTEVTVTNTTNCAAEIMFYDIVPKRDVMIDSSFKTDDGTYTWSSIEDAIREGAKAAAGVVPAGSDVSEYIGASAYDSPIFKNFFKVVKRSHVMLASGSSHRHQQLVGVNRLVETGMIGEGSAGLDTKSYLRGFTYATLILARGVGGYDPAVEPAGDSITNELFLNVVTSLRIKYTYVTDNTNTVHYNNILSTGNCNVRNIGSGAYEAAGPL